MLEAMLLLIAVVAICAIISRHKELQSWFDYLKPITTILIILLAIMGPADKDGSLYKSITLLGLAFSFGGDVLLLRDKWFVNGLGAFLLAHLLFIGGIVNLEGFNQNALVALVLAVVGVAYYAFLWPHLKGFKIPVLCYFIAIIVMMHQAISLYVNHGASNHYYQYIALASVLFAFSDGVIAYNKFVKPFSIAEILILSTYWMSITLIALSVYWV